ncbi:23S rRNA accumulation protein YceD [Aliidiomarina taiwanensis]|uniref:Large ribosomal RNA subunit accumulation protein YceD n=1 Tax=Aliidiomarina taiwanensis TaxID=946228 RepID=A0A432X9R0_9GAMM|nr:23S rRNA accumulation protein YceD [Aliidiomarina taiwanensis]RUO44046.1 23S rRNA accumulation protein YceD [Aliidiomarina taiwanensis]
MKKVRVPITVDPVRSASKATSYDGVVPASGLKRLQEILFTPCDDVAVYLSFDRDEQGIVFFRGNAEVDVALACQRCGKPIEQQVSVKFIYAPTNRKITIDDLPSHYEAVELNELGEVNLHEIVEDELILGLPLVAMHAENECEIDRNAMVFGELPPEAEKKNPFAVLQQLKK